MRSPNGEIVSAQRTTSVVVGTPDELKGLSSSFSDSVLISKDSSHGVQVSTPMLTCPENAIPERLLNGVADKLGNRWEDLAVQLSISFNDVETIRHNEHRDLKRQALTMLHKWQQANGSNATPEVLCEALRNCEQVLTSEWLQEQTNSKL